MDVLGRTMLVVGLRWELLRITKPDLPKMVTGEKKERIFFFFYCLDMEKLLR